METEFRRVSVDWVDSGFYVGWKKHDELEEIVNSKPMLIKSVGWLIEDNDDCIVIAQSVCETQADGILKIPRKSVISMPLADDK